MDRGGIGKTALAIKAAHEAPEGLFERKIFISAKVRELTSDGEKPLTDFTRPTWIAMLDELGRELGEENLERLAPDERPNVLRLALAGKRALIVFDNLETLPEEERTRLFQFLSRLPDGNKAIVTSRRRTDVDARIVRLDRLSHDEAMELIAELAKKYPRLDRASEKERDDLYAMTQGNPLLIRWITGQLGREGSKCRTIADACAFIEKAPKGNDPLEYIFGDLLDTFSPDETLVLAALTFFTKPAKLKWLAQMTGLHERAAETALEDLTDRAILVSDLEARTYYLPPLAAQFIKTRRPEAVVRTGDALVDRAFALAMEYGGDDNYDGTTLEAEWGFISAAMPEMLIRDNNNIQKVCDKLDKFVNYSGKWDDRIWLCEQAEKQAISIDDKNIAGWRSHHAGLTYFRRKQSAEVLACADSIAKHWQGSTPRQKAIAIRVYGLGQGLNKDYQAAIMAFRQALDIYYSISSESKDVVVALNDLANAEDDNKDSVSAEIHYREAIRISKKINFQEGVAYSTGNLAEHSLDLDQWGEAEILSRDALVIAEKIKNIDAIAFSCRILSVALLKKYRNLSEAKIFIRRAIDILTVLCHPDLPKAQQTLTEIEKAMSGE
jgi:tetratricopeptide (TPR) repeat protein